MLPDPTVLHPIAAQERMVFLRTIMTGTATELEGIAAERGRVTG